MSALAAQLRVVVALGGITILTSGCLRGPDPHAVAVLETVMPSFPDGELYFTAGTDGRCFPTDCPSPALRNLWLVDCADLDGAAAALKDDLISEDFTPLERETAPNEGYFTATVDDVTITAYVLATTDASTGSQPTEEPWLSDPASLVGRCATGVQLATG